jgi:hypothetical protein
MYLYRNWVIDAFNRDMPYDQFVREQLAGDLLWKDEKSKSDSPSILQPSSSSSLIATGYLAGSRRHGSYEDARYPWHLTIEDTIDNVGKTFLGLSLHCARCHDHKFDPLLAEDYYAMYGFFSSTRYPWPGIELDRVQRDLVPLGSPGEIAKVTKERQGKLAELDAALKRLETDKAALDKAIADATKKKADVAELKKKSDAAAAAIKSARKDRDQFARRPLPFPTVYAVIDGPAEPKKRIGQVGDVRVQLKGDPDRLGKVAPRRFPLVLGGQTLPKDQKGSGRLELARWITDPANPLTARVMVNRLWQYHFGRGLVATPNDFGKQGRPPSTPSPPAPSTPCKARPHRCSTTTITPMTAS